MERTLFWIERVLESEGQLVDSELRENGEDSWYGATIDTRSECTGRVFFALRGSRTDGHRFVEDAYANGCCAVIVEDKQAARTGAPCLLVKDTLEALQELARAYRDALDTRVVAVTGSMGKTTTKEYIRTILKKKYRVHSNPGNFNNHIGVPLTVLGTDPDSEYLVCEIAANHVGEIDFLSRLLRPDIGVITNIGDAHIGHFGGRDKIAEAKAELFQGVDGEGYAVLPADDKFLDLLTERANCRVVTFGRPESSSYRISNVQETDDKITFDVNDDAMAIKTIGLYNVLNAGAAYAVGELCGVEIEAIRDALVETEPIPGRAKVYRTGGMVVIDDSYNANPTSMRAALDGLSRLSAERKIAVLGDMAELGTFSDQAHRELGVYLAGLSIDILYWFGENGGLVGEGLSSQGSKTVFESFGNRGELGGRLAKEAARDDVILVKASRSCQLDKIVSELLDTIAERGDD